MNAAPCKPVRYTPRLSHIVLISCAMLFSPLLIAGPASDSIKLPAPLSAADFIQTDDARSRLGQLLFFDPILSGNKNIACSSCHHPEFASADGVALSLGDGGQGLGPERIAVTGKNRPEQRIGRNAPALFNLGAKQFQSMFHDGRLEVDTQRASGMRTPLEDDMLQGFDSILSAQSMFPVLSPDEMAGHYNENEVSRAVRMGLITGPDGAWQKISERVQAIPEYVEQFKAAVPSVKQASDIKFTDISNVIAEFISSEWQAIDSPFDHYLQGDAHALSDIEQQGLQLFYGKANCVNCHQGALQTDHDFHAIAMPQFGPGKVARFESEPQDVGRMRVTGKPEDKYKFRTPSLRNVALTAPYGHNGAFATLEGVVRHHLNPAASLAGFELSAVKLAPLPEQDAKDLNQTRLDRVVPELLAASELAVIELTNSEISALVAFLHALTGSRSGAGKLGKLQAVPSGLAVE